MLEVCLPKVGIKTFNQLVIAIANYLISPFAAVIDSYLALNPNFWNISSSYTTQGNLYSIVEIDLI